MMVSREKSHGSHGLKVFKLVEEREVGMEFVGTYGGS